MLPLPPALGIRVPVGMTSVVVNVLVLPSVTIVDVSTTVVNSVVVPLAVGTVVIVFDVEEGCKIGLEDVKLPEVADSLLVDEVVVLEDVDDGCPLAVEELELELERASEGQGNTV